LIENLPIQPVNFLPSEYKLIFGRSREFDLSFYDASNLFLCEIKKASMATLDKKLIVACQQGGIQRVYMIWCGLQMEVVEKRRS